MAQPGVNANYGGETTTDADGTFIVELPTEGLRGTRYASGGYELAVAVTSQSGRPKRLLPSGSRSGRLIRSLLQLPSAADASDGVKDFAVRVMDIAGNPVKRTVYYRISEYENDKEKENAVIASGEFESPVCSGLM